MLKHTDILLSMEVGVNGKRLHSVLVRVGVGSRNPSASVTTPHRGMEGDIVWAIMCAIRRVTCSIVGLMVWIHSGMTSVPLMIIIIRIFRIFRRESSGGRRTTVRLLSPSSPFLLPRSLLAPESPALTLLFFSAAQSYDPCALVCHVAGQKSSFYRLATKVVDGTKCSPDTSDVCVNGRCIVRRRSPTCLIYICLHSDVIGGVLNCRLPAVTTSLVLQSVRIGVEFAMVTIPHASSLQERTTIDLYTVRYINTC